MNIQELLKENIEFNNWETSMKAEIKIPIPRNGIFRNPLSLFKDPDFLFKIHKISKPKSNVMSFQKLCQGVNLMASPKQPQSVTLLK